jgi:hypothetical protein
VLGSRVVVVVVHFVFFSRLGGGGVLAPESFPVWLYINGSENAFLFFAGFGLGVLHQFLS